VIEEGMNLLSRRQYADLARQLKVSLAAVQEAARFIGDNLNPFPARSAWGERQPGPAAPTRVYYQPDIIINQMSDRPNGPLMVEIIMPLYGTLRVNPLYRQAIQEANGEQKDALRGDLDRLHCLSNASSSATTRSSA
jgi:RNA polymerase sigma-54 factor